MKISTKCRYGFRAVLQIAELYGSVPCKRKEIVKRQKLSDSYLENILIMLKSSGLIETTRGIKGGYVLSRPPEEITLLEIFIALEGPLQLVECVDLPEKCINSQECITRTVWKKLSDSWKAILSDMTLQSLLDQKNSTDCHNFCI
ncbi:Rrf2 family transcriptional regulator [Chitinispirillales bacterium ANBcel5]|uniref:RrF2 family transcriptional regulator n=1 Tax=Cellulosispirillum alkaliphilum TaxID=3039283 RepID=UPI002A512181|nr:Rrf2 family transcriptional regulator [Chitinispirillales bacterium ANBcel5]